MPRGIHDGPRGRRKIFDHSYKILLTARFREAVERAAKEEECSAADIIRNYTKQVLKENGHYS